MYGLVDGRYSLIERTGAGAMGIVYRGRDVWLRRDVAIKIIDPAYATDATIRQRFVMEARSLAEVHHDNVVQIYAFGRHEEASALYLAMEYVSGPDLETILSAYAKRGEWIELDAAAAILRYAGRGLDAVHQRGLIHRDVKPSNVIVESETGRPVLIDFGVAQHVVPSPLEIGTSGTPAYMAPEQINGDREITHRSDIYALGCTAYELFTGKLPFHDEQPAVVLFSHFSAPRPLVSAVRPELWAVDEIVARAMAVEPEDRYASCSEFVGDLEHALRRAGSRSELRVVVLERDEGLRRHLERLVLRTFDALHVEVEVEFVSTAAAMSRALLRFEADVTIIDEDSLPEVATLRGLITAIRAAHAEVIVLQRDYLHRPRRVIELGAHGLPKPINARLFESTLGRIGGNAARLREDAPLRSSRGVARRAG
jgi:serine/threonine-protein kinase